MKEYTEFEEFEAYDGMKALSKSHICGQMNNIYTNGVLSFDIKLEQDLLLLWNQIFWIFSRLYSKRYLSEQKKSIENLKKIIQVFVLAHEKDSNYYLMRFNSSKNPSDRIRYSFIYWFLKKDPKYLLETIKISCEIIRNLIDKEKKGILDYIIPCDLLSYAYTLHALYLPEGKDTKNLVRECATKLFNDATENKFGKSLLKPSEIIYNMLGDNEHDFSSRVITGLHKGANEASIKKENGEIERQLLDSSFKFIKFLNITEIEKENIKKIIYSKIAQSYEKKAEIRQGRGDLPIVIARYCYLPAAKNFQSAGDHKKYNENMILYRQNNYFPPEALIEYELIIHNTPMFEGDDEDSIIESISTNDYIIPDQVRIRAEVESEVNQYPLSHAFPSQHVSAAKPASNEEEIKSQKEKEKMILHIQFYENILSQSFLKLQQAGKLSIDGIMRHMSKFSLLDQNSLQIIRNGISHHFSYDYIASIHILIPQIENILRILIKNSEINILKEKNDSIMNKILKDLLGIPEVSQLIGIDFSDYLKIKYVDLHGINLRNDVSHGLAKLEGFNNTNSFAIIYAILRLLRLIN